MSSDLIILQKNTQKKTVTPTDKLFATTAPNAAGIVTNNYFEQYPDRIIHTKEKVNTDPYGKPAMVYLHEGGVEWIAADMRKTLSEDFAERLNLDLYNVVAPQQSEQVTPYATIQPEPTPRQEPTPEDWHFVKDIVDKQSLCIGA